MVPATHLILTSPGPGGKHRDFSRPAGMLKLWKLIRNSKPCVVSGSLPCAACSILQTLGTHRPGEKSGSGRSARTPGSTCKFGCELYARQIRQGLYLFHDRAECAERWKATCVAGLMNTPGAMASTIDQCRYGVFAKGCRGIAAATAPVKIVTDPVWGQQKETHLTRAGCERDARLTSGRAEGAAAYPVGCAWL